MLLIHYPSNLILYVVLIICCLAFWIFGKQCMQKERCSRNQVVVLYVGLNLLTIILSYFVLYWYMNYNDMIALQIMLPLTYLLPCLTCFFIGLTQQNAAYRLQSKPFGPVYKSLLIILFLLTFNNFIEFPRQDCESAVDREACFFFYKYNAAVFAAVNITMMWLAIDFIMFYYAEELEIVSNGKVVGKLVKENGLWTRLRA